MSARYTIEKAQQLVSASADKTYGVLLSRGTLELGYYQPNSVDPQQPHTQDEIYIVQSGSGYFVCGDERQPFAQGEALFVPAGAVHRFEDFSDDFSVWVIFYGPQGGENDNS